MPSLKKNLGFLGVLAISLAVMSPSMSVSLNPQAIAGQVGAAVPTIYLLAVIPLGIVVMSFVVLTRRRGSAGSLFSFVSAEIGPRTGTATGLWMLAAYTLGATLLALAFGIFVSTLLHEVGVLSGPVAKGTSGVIALIVAAGSLPVATWLSGRTMRALGVALFVLEIATMVTILVVLAITVVRLLGSGGPEGQTLAWSGLRLQDVSLGALAIALTFALLTSIGFEGSATAGEETKDPRRTVPRVLIWTTVTTTIFFIAVTIVGVWAYGESPDAMQKFAQVGSVPAAIGSAYVSLGVGIAITLGVAISALTGVIGVQVAGGRILYAMGRGGIVSNQVAKVSRHGTPAFASAVVGFVAFVVLVVAVGVVGGEAFSAFELAGDAAALTFSAVYAVACGSAAVALWRGSRGRWWAVIPVLGVVILGAVIALQLFPIPSGWKLVAPVTTLAIIVGGALVGRLRGGRSIPSIAAQ